ncbi:hypothetical protein SMY46_002732 [Cronobacter turicensis]|uniref:hypothetical protein n=1 Tax=Cronobacter turicensis TaxID=413502 RepID=UPI0011AC0B4C|nr:hypothetical protein [Cronobacter turicensis]EKY3118093.1 hypothetical protein [Cronobacter turicensis]ELU8453810.1 hypothetical protein [Cronobacter turicensis]ELY4111039.1 hypothetical protein [Cronobacter turicensis]ELY4217405.1 hypothetical protein [Cronobacter turicensis]EMA1791242.1 hypothetical protein [Cronobacter turicensis]
MPKNASPSVASKVRHLAAVHNISASCDSTSRMATAITRLSGDTVVLDNVEQLLVNLKRKGVLTKAESLSLQADYLEEKRQSRRKVRA